MNDQSTESLKDGPGAESPRRCRLDAGQWRALIDRQAESGRTVAEFCDEHGVGVASFYSWRRRLNEESAEAEAGGFVRVESAEPRGSIEVRFDCGATLRCGSSHVDELVRMLIEAGRSC